MFSIHHTFYVLTARVGKTNRYHVPPFKGLNIFLSGFDVQQQEALESKICAHGGVLSEFCIALGAHDKPTSCGASHILKGNIYLSK